MDQEFKQLVDQIAAERKVSAPADAPSSSPTDSPWYDFSSAFKTAGDIANRMTLPGAIIQPAMNLMAGEAEDATSPLDAVAKVDPIGTAATTGAMKAVTETNDFVRELAGQHITEDQKSDLRKTIETTSNTAASQSTAAALTGPVAQFVTGLIGAGKLMAPLKASGLVAKGAKEVAKGALAGGIVMDPHEERLSNLIQEFPALENPVTEYLAASPDDGYMEGRMKNALEGAGMDLALSGAFLMGLKAVKLARMGDPEAAKAVLQDLADQKMVDEVVASEAAPTVDPLVVPEPVQGDIMGEKPRVRVKAGRMDAAVDEPPAASISEPALMDPTLTQSTLAPPDGVTKATDNVVSLQGISEQQVKDIIRGTEFDLLAIDQAGSRSEAMLQGYKFAPEASIPWQKLQTPEDISTLIANTTSVLRPELNAMKGGEVLADATVERMVRNAARYFNEDPAALIGEIAQSGEAATQMVKSMEAGYLLSTRMFMDAYDVIDKMRWGNLTEYGGDATQALAEARRRMATAFNVYASAQSIRSNVGRTMRRMRSEYGITPESLAKLNSLSDDKFMDIMQGTGGDPKKLKEIAKPSFMAKVLDEVSFSQRNGLLWLYPTHVINVTSNVYMQIARPLEKAIGSFVLSGGKAVRQQAAKEFYYTAAAITDGWKAGAEAFMRGDSGLAPHMTDWLDTNGATSTAHKPLSVPNFKPWDSWENVWHNAHVSSLYRNVTGLPTRALGAQDEFFKTLRYRGVVQARAAVTADQIGLKGSERKAFIEDRLLKAFDEEGRAVDREALTEAQTATFNQELLPKTVGASIRNFRSAHPAVGLVLPFVKTPINVLRYAHKYTPGLNLLQKEYRQMIGGAMGVEQQAQAVGQMALGTLFMGTSYLFASSGRVTGGGPSDSQLKKQLIEQGWKPYSFKVENADGTITYVPYGRFDPVGLPMGIMADLHELFTVDPENRSIGDLTSATAIALAKNFSERSFLLNMNQLIDALSDPENKMEKFLGNLGASTVPMSSAMRGYMNSDPYLREARDLVDRILKDVPGYSEGLPPRRDVWGDPVSRRIGVTTTMNEDPVEAEHNRIMLETGDGISAPSPTHSGVDLREVTLKDGRNAYDRYQEIASKPFDNAPSLKESLQKLIESDDYLAMVDGEAGQAGSRLNAISGVVQKYRAAAFKRLQAENPEVGKAVITGKYKALFGTIENKTGQAGLGEKILKSLGY